MDGVNKAAIVQGFVLITNQRSVVMQRVREKFIQSRKSRRKRQIRKLYSFESEMG